MPALSRRQPSLDLRKAAFSSASSSARASFESNDGAERVWAFKQASLAGRTEEMDLPRSKLSSLPSRQQKKTGNALSLQIKAELHDSYQSSEEEASPNPEEDWDSDVSTDGEFYDSRDETVTPLGSSLEAKPIVAGEYRFELAKEWEYLLNEEEVITCHTAQEIRLPITCWHKPNMIDIPPPSFRLKKSMISMHRQHHTCPAPKTATMPMPRPARKESLRGARPETWHSQAPKVKSYNTEDEVSSESDTEDTSFNSNTATTVSPLSASPASSTYSTDMDTALEAFTIRTIKPSSINFASLALAKEIDSGNNNNSNLSSPSSYYSQSPTATTSSAPVSPAYTTTTKPSTSTHQPTPLRANFSTSTPISPPLSRPPPIPQPHSVPLVLDHQNRTLKHKSSSTWKTVTKNISRARKATLANANYNAANYYNYSYNTDDAINSAGGAVRGDPFVNSTIASSSPGNERPALPTASKTAPSLGGGVGRPKMVARGAAEREEFVLPDFVLVH
ncbi:hypothetical protein MMC25_004150 [Agyrium rufum]|nr:hypothetical protein [Agyrium rufum]